MMLEMTKIMYDYIRENTDWAVAAKEHGTGSYLQIRMISEDDDGKQEKPRYLRLISIDEQSDVVTFMLGPTRVFAEEQVEKILSVLNKMNRKYRFEKFVLDPQRDVFLLKNFYWSEEFLNKHLLSEISRAVGIFEYMVDELEKAIGGEV